LPELRRLTHPSDEVFPEVLDDRYFSLGEVGILRYRTSRASTQIPFTPPTPTLTHNPASALVHRDKSPSLPNTDIDDYDAYKIATLSPRWRSGSRKYDLCTYDSYANAWTRKPTVFSEPQDSHVKHSFDRVITIGDKMGWVDLGQGIILCNVHTPAGQEESPGSRLPRYVPLPKPMEADNDLHMFCEASFSRDTTVIQGLIKFVDL
jgi:hypothetical protein